MPLVNVRYWLTLFDTKKLFGVPQRRVIELARKIHFIERTPSALQATFGRSLGASVTDSLFALSGGSIPDVKRADAIGLLAHLGNEWSNENVDAASS